jgi:hypothetical protein
MDETSLRLWRGGIIVTPLKGGELMKFVEKPPRKEVERPCPCLKRLFLIIPPM